MAADRQDASRAEETDMVLCDMSEYNPNVFFELGVRTSVNKPIALVRCNDQDRIPFDVSGINTHTYDPALKAWKHEAQVDALAQHLRDAETSCAGTNPLWRQFGMQLTATEPTSEGTKEEAMLSVMSHNLEQLVEALAQRSAQPPARESARETPSWALETDQTLAVERLILDAATAYRVELLSVDFDESGVRVHYRSLGEAAGGSKRFTQEVGRELAKMGWNVTFLRLGRT